MDATVVASASESDENADWSGHRPHKSIHGDEAHVGVNADTSLVAELAVTPGNAHDGRNGEHARFQTSLAMFAQTEKLRSGTPYVIRTGVWAKHDPEAMAEAEKKVADWNAVIYAIRCRIEGIFGIWKRSYGFRRMQWRRLAKARLQPISYANFINRIRSRYKSRNPQPGERQRGV